MSETVQNLQLRMLHCYQNEAKKKKKKKEQVVAKCESCLTHMLFTKNKTVAKSSKLHQI